MLRIAEAPPQLVAHCTPAPPSDVTKTGEKDIADAIELYRWLAEKDAFDDYESWLGAGMAAKVEFGDAGLSLWAATHRPDVTPDVIATKWNSFASEPRPGCVTIASLLKRAHALGWQGQLRRSTASMFGNVVAQLAAAPSIVPASSPLAVFSATALEGQPVPPRRWLVRDLIPEGTVTLLSGDGGTGKSLLALQLAVSTATGRPWINRPIHPGGCLFLSAEDSRDELHRRLADIARSNGQRLADMGALHLVSLAGEDAILAAPEGRTNVIQRTALYDALDAQIASLRPALVVLDTLADLFAGEENNRAQARQFVGLLRGLAQRHGTTILLLSHPSLTGMNSGTGTSGSTAWNNSVRSRLYFDRLRGEGGMETDPDARVLRSMKSNYGRVGEEFVLYWRSGVFVPETITAGGFKAMQDAKERADEIFLSMLATYDAEQRGAVSPNPGKNYAPSIFADDARAQGCKKRALKDAMDRLLASGKIETTVEGPPSRLRYGLKLATNATTNAILSPSNGGTNATYIPTNAGVLITNAPTNGVLSQPPIPPTSLARP